MDVSLRPSRKLKAQFSNADAGPRPAKRQRPDFAKQIGAVSSPNAPEKKNVDVTTTAVGAAATTWSPVTFLNQIAQGSTANSRIGRRVTITSIFLRWVLTVNNGCARWMVIYDHAPNGALPVITDILTIDSITAPMNLINNDRFLVLHDELINPNAANLAFGGKWIYKGSPLQNQFTNAVGGTIAEVTTGAIYVMCVGNSAAPTLSFTSRIRFTDM